VIAALLALTIIITPTSAHAGETRFSGGPSCQTGSSSYYGTPVWAGFVPTNDYYAQRIHLYDRRTGTHKWSHWYWTSGGYAKYVHNGYEWVLTASGTTGVSISMPTFGEIIQWNDVYNHKNGTTDTYVFSHSCLS
jgi:hypothetical protein